MRNTIKGAVITLLLLATMGAGYYGGYPFSPKFGNVNITGNTTLGDAVGDTITTNAGTVTVANTLNFDANTLVVDPTANEVRVATAADAGAYALQVAGTAYATVGFNANGSTVWHAGNDGSASTLDADLIDGLAVIPYKYSLTGATWAEVWDPLNAFTGVRNSTGQVTLTHNWGTTNYSCTNMSLNTAGNGYFIYYEAINNNTMVLQTVTHADTVIDADANTIICVK